MKERSAGASFVAGYRLYTEHFRRIFKTTWTVGLLTALLSGAAATAVFVYWPELIARVFSDIPNAWQYADEYKMLLTVVILLSLLTVMATAAFGGASAAAILNIRQSQPASLWRMMLRSLKDLLCNVLLFGAGFGLLAVFIYWRRAMLLDPAHNVASLAMAVVLFTLLCIVLLPTAYLSTKYLMDSSTGFWPLLFRRYPTSMRYWGRQFVVVLVCFFLSGILSFIVSLPGIILYQANWEARIGVVGGDALGMPGHITALTFVTCAVITYLLLYIWLPLLTSLYYVYGAIDTREAQRLRKQQQATP